MGSVGAAARGRIAVAAALLCAQASCARTQSADIADCTAEHIAEFKELTLSPELENLKPEWARSWTATRIAASERKRTLKVATDWARRNCYLPCEYAMCGVVREGPPGHVVVYLRPGEDFFVSPEADVLIDL